MSVMLYRLFCLCGVSKHKQVLVISLWIWYNDCTINSNLQVRREIMNTEIRVAIDKFKEVKDILKKFDSKDEAIEYLVNETKLSKEECSTAYDIIIKIEN